jgi:short-subunit dehydrogenase
MNGFQEGLQMEIPKNVKLTCLYPIATDTGFFKKATEGSSRKITERPFPVQSPKVVARRMVKGMERGKKYVNPSKLFVLSKVLMAICPPIKWAYLALENKKLSRFLAQQAEK